MIKEKKIEGIDPKIAVDWGLPEEENPVRNTVHRYLKFKNTKVFSPAAEFFKKHKCYTFSPEGTIDYENFWDEEERRCRDGYEVGGVRITGRHYFYLNYCQIKMIPVDEAGKPLSQNKKIDFPRFLDHNYYYLLELEKNMAEGPWKNEPKKGNIVVKGRRKGHTYIITGAVYAYNYTFIPESMNMLAAGETSHYKVTLDGIHFSINNVNEYTAWAKKKLIDQRDHFKSGYWEINELGNKIEKGYKSEISAISFSNNPFKSIGESCTIVGYEEAGKFHNLITSYNITEPTFREGDTMIGVPIVWGTGGDMEGGTADLNTMFYSPSTFGIEEYDNIYDDNATNKCGYFIDSMWFYTGSATRDYTVNGQTFKKGTLSVDKHGNSIRRLAYGMIMERRNIAKGNKKTYNDNLTQFPLTPSEAFLRTSGTIFDTVRAQKRLSEIEASSERFRSQVDIGFLEQTRNGTVNFIPNRDLHPIYEFPLKDNVDKPGALQIYEHPIVDKHAGKPYSNRYIAGIDSYEFDTSGTKSVGSIIVMDRLTSRIVAHFKGRPKSSDFYEICRKLLLYYNGKANYEKASLGIFNYFDKMKCLHLLCDQPEILKEQHLTKVATTGNGKKGTPPTQAVNAFGLELTEEWLSEYAYDVNEINADGTYSTNILNYDILPSELILKEIIKWSDIGNFDDISALIMLMIYRADLKKIKVKMNEVVTSVYKDDFFQRKL